MSLYPSPAVNAPMTHTASKTDKIRIRVTLSCVGTTNGQAFHIISSSSESAFVFDKNDTFNGTSTKTLEIESSAAIGESIRKISSSVVWSMTSTGLTNGDLGTSGSHTIYTTIGTPNVSAPANASIPTPARMELGVTRVAAAITETGTSTNYPKLVWCIMKNSGAYALGLPDLGDAEAWTFPTVAPQDCISIARFVRNVCMVIGIPGTLEAKKYMAYYATANDPSRPNTALEGNLAIPDITPGSQGAPKAGVPPLQTGWVLALADKSCTNAIDPTQPPGTVGCTGGLNNFEAAVVYTNSSANTWYFPAGATGNLHYTNKDSVVKIFKSLVWIAMADHDNNPLTPKKWTVQFVDFRYTKAQDNAF